ncbi:MAG: transposase [Deltaproteobacteria bacterium]|nr:transposase [Deltaproteobacteria bacterium]
MSRPLRIEYPNAWHHVMNRARRGQTLFKNGDDYACFLDLLQETADMFNIRISAYCFMPTHYHILVQTPEMNLARCMRHLNGVFTQRYNIRHKSDGTLFRGRYKSILVEQDSYLLQLVRYIHRNPFKADMVEKLDEYQWSSHRGYITRAKQWNWLYKDFILTMLTPNKGHQIKKYKQFVSIEDSQEIQQMFDRAYLPSILGSEGFVKWVKKVFFAEKRNKEIPDSKALAPDGESIIKTICRYYKIDEEKIFSVKRGTENEARNVAIYLMRKLRGEPLVKIGFTFNLTKHSSVSSVIERTGRKLQNDRRFKKRIKKISAMVIKGQEET